MRSIYISSKAAHGSRWRDLRAEGWPIISTWIDEAEAGATGDWPDLWQRCVSEAASADVLIVYREPGEVLKGAFVEMGAALAAGKPVFAVGLEEFSVRHHPSVRVFPTLHAARAALLTPPRSPTMDDLTERVALDLAALRAANIARNEEWNTGSEKVSLTFRGCELAGEVGEALNLVKKLERERIGIVGSRASLDDLADELADVVICVDLLGMDLGIDLASALVRKFNHTSEKYGLAARLAALPPPTSGAAEMRERAAKKFDAARMLRKMWTAEEVAAAIRALPADDGAADTAETEARSIGPLPQPQAFLIEWLSKQETSAYGECKGSDFDAILMHGLVEFASRRTGPLNDYARVCLTARGQAYARLLKAGHHELTVREK